MNYKAFKILSIFVAILFVFSCSLTVLGYITNKNKNNLPPKPIETENGTIVERNIKYKYYLENEEVDSIPTNPKPDENSTTEDQLVYRFDQYNCTEGVTGNFKRFCLEKNFFCARTKILKRIIFSYQSGILGSGC